MNTREMTKCALLLALLILLGFIPAIPVGFIPAPIILQNMGILLIGLLVKERSAVLVVVGFLLLAAIGLPVLSGGRGGYVAFIGPTAGYLFSYPLAAFFISHFKKKTKNVWQLFAILLLFGVVLIDTMGAVWMSLTQNIPLASALYGTLIFVPGDVIKAILALLVYTKIPQGLVETVHE